MENGVSQVPNSVFLIYITDILLLIVNKLDNSLVLHFLDFFKDTLNRIWLKKQPK